MGIKKIGNRLAWIHSESASADYWREHWMGGSELKTKLMEIAKVPSLEPYEQPLLRYLPQDGKILEAGCGYGPYVLVLQKRGYDVEGIDYSGELVSAVKNVMPELSIRWGNAMVIDRPDGYYSGYLSLGVMEHRIEGPEPFLKEGFRVLAPGGIAFIAVPFYDLFWRLRSPWLSTWVPDGNTEQKFFQWHFTREEFVSLAKSVGFHVVETGSVAVRTGFVRVLPFLQPLVRMRGGYRLLQLFSFVEECCRNCGWMQWIIARKAG